MPFFHFGGVEFKPIASSGRGSFFYSGVVGFQPLEGTCSIIFSQLLDSECACVTKFVRMTYSGHHYRYLHPIVW